ncbi:MAG: hypothetical protein FWC36_10970 [Spirochaetes bacterium]|nr:hypothetical protein [Spirochaetota bacterium]
MSNVKANSEAIRKINADIGAIIKELAKAVRDVRQTSQQSAEWNDYQGEQYRNLMVKIAALIESPIGPLEAAQPKLNRLAESLDSYSRVKF